MIYEKANSSFQGDRMIALRNNDEDESEMGNQRLVEEMQDDNLQTLRHGMLSDVASVNKVKPFDLQESGQN